MYYVLMLNQWQRLFFLHSCLFAWLRDIAARILLLVWLYGQQFTQITFSSRFCSFNNTNTTAFVYIFFTLCNKWVYLSYTRMLICHTNISWSNESCMLNKKTRSFGRPDRLPDWQVNRWHLPRCHCHEYCNKHDYAVCICVKSNIL